MRKHQPVKFTRKNGETAEGKFAGKEMKGNGEWAIVKHADKTETRVRMSQLSPA